MKRFAITIIAVVLLAGASVGVQGHEGRDGASLERCTTLTDDELRLACYDAAAGNLQEGPGWIEGAPEGDAERKVRAAAQQKGIRAAVMRRCRKDMQAYGSAMVKDCVDEDMAAFHALLDYGRLDVTREIESRCYSQMMAYGWAMIKDCIDVDMEAERALKRMSQ